MGARKGSAHADLIEKISSASPGDARDSIYDIYEVAGGAQAMLHPDWVGSALIVGGPGQGKTTLLQYVCQFHRARRLGKTGDYTTGETLDQVTSVIRVPFRIELRKYVEWAKTHTRVPRKRTKKAGSARRATGQEREWPTLEEFLAHEIRSRSGLPFTVKDFSTLVASEPVLLALDGLDEVAAVGDRDEVGRQAIDTQAGLEALGFDVVVLVATRPGAETARLWSASAFSRLHLLPLTPGQRLQYFHRWAAAARLDGEATDKLQRKLLSRQHELHVKELASTPMQLAILLHLLQRKGVLPEERTELYRHYIETFLDREQAHDKEPLLSEQRRLVVEVHQRLAWLLQAAVEEGRSSGSIGRVDLPRILREQLADRPQGLEFAQALFESFEARVMCLVERDGAFEFEVQSLREYFAAVYISDTAPARGGVPKDARLMELLARPYWSNVTRFLVGMWSPGEIKGLRYCFLDLMGRGRLSPDPPIGMRL